MVSPITLKRQENQERREREALLNDLSVEWATKLESADFLYSFEFFSTFPIPSLDEPAKRKDYLSQRTTKHSDFDDLAHAKAYLTQLNVTLKPPVLLWLGKGPVFRLLEPINTDELSALAFKPHFQAIIVEQGLAQGILLNEYLGYLTSERATNNRELIYDVVYFS